MTHLKIFLLLIVCAFSAQAANAQNSKTTVDELNGKRIGVIGDSYVRNHKEPFENTWHYKFAKKHGMEYFNYVKDWSRNIRRQKYFSLPVGIAKTSKEAIRKR